MKVLMIEDEFVIAEPMVELLQGHNYVVDWEANGEDGLYAAINGNYDLILLDIMLPGIDGLCILREIRSNKILIPVIMLTARDQLEDKIKGLDFGADDYLPKPFEFSELLARMRAILRRSTKMDESNTISSSNFTFDPYNNRIQSVDSEEHLTLKEAQLLEMLLSRRKIIITKDMIIEKLWSLEEDATYSHVDYHISKLRSKLKNIKALVKITSIRGIGYRLEEDRLPDEK